MRWSVIEAMEEAEEKICIKKKHEHENDKRFLRAMYSFSDNGKWVKICIEIIGKRKLYVSCEQCRDSIERRREHTPLNNMFQWQHKTEERKCASKKHYGGNDECFFRAIQSFNGRGKRGIEHTRNNINAKVINVSLEQYSFSKYTKRWREKTRIQTNKREISKSFFPAIEFWWQYKTEKRENMHKK